MSDDPIDRFRNEAPQNKSNPAYTSLTQYQPNNPLKPYSAVKSSAPIAKPRQPVKIDAFESQDYASRPCKNFVFDFGDGTPPQQSTNPVLNHTYSKPGTYPVKVTCIDRDGNKATATLTQVVDNPPPFNSYQSQPKQGPPSAQLASNPKETKPQQPVSFDASKSKDAKGQPCTKFVWDFGDGSPQKTTNGPYIKHPYQNTGTYPVTVTVTDRTGQTAQASVNQRYFRHKIKLHPIHHNLCHFTVCFLCFVFNVKGGR